MTETPQSGQAQTEQTQAGSSPLPQQTRGQERISPTQRAPLPQGPSSAVSPSPWAGWIIFASMIMLMVATFQVIIGLTAVFKNSYYAVTQSGLLLNVNYAAWGWTHIGIGLILAAAAMALVTGQMWARVVCIAVALVSAVVNLGFVDARPLWSLTVIALDVVIIYAVAVHGSELKTPRQ